MALFIYYSTLTVNKMTTTLKRLNPGTVTTDIDAEHICKGEINLNKLTVMTGLNGTGKSLIMKVYWLLDMLTNLYYMSGKDSAKLTEFVQFAIDGTFIEQNFTGNLVLKYDLVETIMLLDKGKVMSFNVIDLDKNNPLNESEYQFGMPQYMSSATRLFTNIQSFAKFRKALGMSSDVLKRTEADMKTLVESYRLYDIMFMEAFLARVSDPFFKISDSGQKTIKDNLKRDITNIFFDENTAELCFTEVIDKVPVKKSIVLLSAGEQSLINMIVNHQPHN